MLNHFVKFQIRANQVRGERGAAATEYGLMVALIALALIVGVSALGVALDAVFTQTLTESGLATTP